YPLLVIQTGKSVYRAKAAFIALAIRSHARDLQCMVRTSLGPLLPLPYTGPVSLAPFDNHIMPPPTSKPPNSPVLLNRGALLCRLLVLTSDLQAASLARAWLRALAVDIPFGMQGRT